MTDTDTRLNELVKELEILEEAFYLVGGRGIELAEQIDTIREDIRFIRALRKAADDVRNKNLNLLWSTND
jgi:hypothetical protein